MYSYDPRLIGEMGKDRMRFELGDIVRDGEEFDPYVSDEEIEAILDTGCTWTHAKVLILESIVRSLSYEVDTKVGPLSLELGERAKRWKAMLDELKLQDVSISDAAASAASRRTKPPYFHPDMHHNYRSDFDWRHGR